MAGTQDENPQRGNWSGKADYLLSLAGYAIGIGNVWRFPYLCYKNGGGAFLIPYLVMLVALGLPLFLLESAVGQFSSSGSISLYNVCPIFKGIGYASLLVNLVASTYYSVIVAYPLVFFYHSLASTVPWASCDNYWNTDACATTLTLNDTALMDPFLHQRRVTPADEFFHNNVLSISSGIEDPDGFQWSIVLATLFLWTFVFLCIFKGVKVVGKVVWFTATFPFVMLLVLFFRGVTLPGASDGIRYYLYPSFDKLLQLNVWIEAAVQIFFSLGPGWGTLITMGSFNRFHNNCFKDALLIPLINCATSFFAGFAVFSVLGFLSHQLQTTVQDVTASGPGLAFIAYPEALAMMPFAPVWSALFFLMLFFLGVDSIFVQMESSVASLVDEFPNLRPWRSWVAFVTCFVTFLGALSCCTRGGMYVIQLLDMYSVLLTILFGSLCFIIVFAYIYGAGRVAQDLQVMTGQALHYLWYYAWIAVTPFVLLFLLLNSVFRDYSYPVSYRGYIYPNWAVPVGWLTSAASLLAIPGYFIYYLMVARGPYAKYVRYGFKPTPSWGPALEIHRQEWAEFALLYPIRHRTRHPGLDNTPLVVRPKPLVEVR